VDTRVGDAVPADTVVANTAPADTVVADTAPANTAPADTVPADTVTLGTPPLAAVVYRRLYRDPERKLVAGVAAGLAAHLGVEVLAVRAAFTVLAALQGAGLLMYAALWVFVPQTAEPTPPPASRWSRGRQLLGLGALAACAVTAAVLTGVWQGSGIAPLVLAGAGVGLIWRQADEAQRRHWAGLPRRLVNGDSLGGTAALLRLVGGGALVLAGMAGFLATHDALVAARQGVLATVVVVAGLALVSAPVWWRLARELSEERRERIRSEERADLAARVHDSVLQTLTLIQRHAADPGQVQRLARASERELRSWLYRPTVGAEQRFGAAVEAAAADVEDTHGMPFEVVGVGDQFLDDRLRAVLAAAREAMVNAAKSSGAPSAAVFYEVSPERLELFVRDRGCGFDPAAVPSDRYGIRESILTRMTRCGGSATVRSAPGQGTEVALAVPLTTTRGGE
jgi:signal transduction histidine kinase